jgi:hypothetical protein
MVGAVLGATCETGGGGALSVETQPGYWHGILMYMYTMEARQLLCRCTACQAGNRWCRYTDGVGFRVLLDFALIS